MDLLKRSSKYLYENGVNIIFFLLYAVTIYFSPYIEFLIPANKQGFEILKCLLLFAVIPPTRRVMTNYIFTPIFQVTETVGMYLFKDFTTSLGLFSGSISGAAIMIMTHYGGYLKSGFLYMMEFTKLSPETDLISMLVNGCMKVIHYLNFFGGFSVDLVLAPLRFIIEKYYSSLFKNKVVFEEVVNSSSDGSILKLLFGGYKYDKHYVDYVYNKTQTTKELVNNFFNGYDVARYKYLLDNADKIKSSYSEFMDKYINNIAKSSTEENLKWQEALYIIKNFTATITDEFSKPNKSWYEAFQGTTWKTYDSFRKVVTLGVEAIDEKGKRILNEIEATKVEKDFLDLMAIEEEQKKHTIVGLFYRLIENLVNLKNGIASHFESVLPESIVGSYGKDIADIAAIISMFAVCVIATLAVKKLYNFFFQDVSYTSPDFKLEFTQFKILSSHVNNYINRMYDLITITNKNKVVLFNNEGCETIIQQAYLYDFNFNQKILGLIKKQQQCKTWEQIVKNFQILLTTCYNLISNTINQYTYVADQQTINDISEIRSMISNYIPYQEILNQISLDKF